VGKGGAGGRRKGWFSSLFFLLKNTLLWLLLSSGNKISEWGTMLPMVKVCDTCGSHSYHQKNRYLEFREKILL